MFGRRKNRPEPGRLYYPDRTTDPAMRSTWYLTVNERLPKKGSLEEYENNRIANWVVGGREESPDMRLQIFIHDPEGRLTDPFCISMAAVRNIGSEVLKGNYNGKLEKKDFPSDMRYFCLSNKRPRCKLSGEDGNIFNLISLASKALITAGQKDKAEEMKQTIFREAKDYDHAIEIIRRYVEVY